MHPGSKRKRCPSLENVDLEQQQQTLFDVSVLKLQQEQLRHGVEPRLLRFVLINNALRTLQSHMLQLVEDDDLLGPLNCDPFLCNTFRKHGPVSIVPPTPAKVLKLETTAFTEQSPLIASSPWSAVEGEGEGGGGGGEKEEKRPVSLAVVNGSITNVLLGKHAPSTEDSSVATAKAGEKVEGEEGERKKPCGPHLNGTKLNGTTALFSMLEHLSPPSDPPPLSLPSTNSSLREEEEEERASTPSPIDFTKVDPSIYDYDTRTNLTLPGTTVSAISPSPTSPSPVSTPPPLPSPSRETTGSKGTSCALQTIASPVVQNGEQLGRRTSRNGLPATPEGGGVVGAGGGESDFLDDLDHIVSLLMT